LRKVARLVMTETGYAEIMGEGLCDEVTYA
jgi:hypothetical protein